MTARRSIGFVAARDRARQGPGLFCVSNPARILGALLLAAAGAWLAPQETAAAALVPVFKDCTTELGLAISGDGACWADYDNDGDLDLVTAGRLYQNQGAPNRWIKVRLEGDGQTVDASALGAQVRIKLKDRTLTRHVEAGTGEGNQNDLVLHFGLGSHTEPVDLEVFWPIGRVQTVPSCPVDRLVSVRFKPAP